MVNLPKSTATIIVGHEKKSDNEEAVAQRRCRARLCSLSRRRMITVTVAARAQEIEEAGSRNSETHRN